MNVIDIALLRDAIKAPGIDLRTWVSYGTVAEDSPDQHSVIFKDEEDAPIPEGPLVITRLEPSGIIVPCRVSSHCAGVGEAEWTPFGQGDEVLVVIPEGDTHAGCCIIGRLNNSFDTFPFTVGGQDSTQNTFGFKRMRSPFILETAESYLIRSAKTGSQFGIDQAGQVIFNDGDGSRFFMGSEVVGMSLADGSTSIQMIVDDNSGGRQQVRMTAGNTTSFLMDAGASQFTTTGSLVLGTSGGLSLGHAVTLEEVVGLLINFLIMLAGPMGSSTLASELTAAGKLLSAIPSPFPAVLDLAISTFLVAQATPGTPPTPTTPGSTFALFPLTFGPVGATTNAVKIPGSQQDVTGFIPGIGRPGLLF